MNLIGKERSQGGANNRRGGFTLVEVMVGVVILALVVVTMFALLTAGFAIVRFNRENLRATQIMLNRIEGLRLCNWSQLEDEALVPRKFSENYFSLGTADANQGTVFNGELDIDTAVQEPPSKSSETMMRKVTVRVSWTSGKSQHIREMTTYVSKYGIQNYLLGS